ncbi:hypothetical protein ACFQH9_02135 [Pseudonocardia lutea]|uniref:Uncharacterized protein n=1 Tax=Pseudonocardia lutea TaxID=2172015 RepID=A0ABW1I033_9PSEU
MSGLRKVRTKMRPSETLEVTEAEYTDLKRQGLLLPEKKHDAEQKPANSNKKEN